MSNTRIIIARHGNTFASGDVVTRLGKTDLPLVESGLEQGRNIGKYLKNSGMIPDVIFSSDLRRTKETAERAQSSMGTSLSVISLIIFNEIDYGVDENKPEAEVVARLGEEALKLWDEEAIVPQGWRVDPDRIIADWKNFAADILKKYPGKTILVVTSNGIARFAPYLTGDFAKFRLKHKIKISTGALCIFENHGSSSLWECKEWNLKPKF